MRIGFLMTSCLSLLFIASSCSRAGGSEPQIDLEYVKDFVVHTSKSDYRASIDNQAFLITVGGLERASEIKSVTVSLAEGCSIQPDPSSIIEWSSRHIFYVTANGAAHKYVCTLPDLKDEPDPASDYVVFGYFRFDDSFDDALKYVDLSKVTHVIATRSYVKSDGTLDVSKLSKLPSLQSAAKKAGAKVLVSVEKAESGAFEAGISTAEKRERLASQIIEYVRAQGLDGFDVDYEDYASISTATGNANLKDFIQRLYSKKAEGMLMTSAVLQYPKYGSWWADYFDYVSVMSYGHTKAFQHASYDDFVSDISNVNANTATPYSKLVGGLPFFGFIWENGERTGDIKYRSIIKKYASRGAADLDYIESIYYNGRPTIRKKCQYAKSKGLAGVMIWDLTLDSYEPEYKLLDVIAEEML